MDDVRLLREHFMERSFLKKGEDGGTHGKQVVMLVMLWGFANWSTSTSRPD